jgi:hypothetical protein
VKAYERTKAYGEEETILDRPVVFKNGALRGTSAWGNTFLKRDHNAPVAIEGNGSENLANPDAGGSANGSD